MKSEFKIGDKLIGEDHPTYIIGEIGINHNGDIEVAKQLIDLAKWAGVDAVKFQKRTPDLATPDDQKDKMRETPWGYITYLDYRYKVEFDEDDYKEIDAHCKAKGIHWFASAWDEPSVDFMEKFDTLAYKIPSASLTDHKLLKHIKSKGRPIILSTGMSTMDEIRETVNMLGTDNLMLTHTTSTYPCEPEELNLRMIQTLKNEFSVPVGYSGHETGLVLSAVAVAMGADLVERHITLDRAMWGSDQAASVEPGGLQRLVKYIRVTEEAKGDGVKKVYDSELPSLQKLRRAKK